MRNSIFPCNSHRLAIITPCKECVLKRGVVRVVCLYLILTLPRWRKTFCGSVSNCSMWLWSVVEDTSEFEKERIDIHQQSEQLVRLMKARFVAIQRDHHRSLKGAVRERLLTCIHEYFIHSRTLFSVSSTRICK